MRASLFLSGLSCLSIASASRLFDRADEDWVAPSLPSSVFGYVKESVQGQIRSDVTAVVNAFNATTEGNLQQIALAALQLPLLQSWPEVPSEQFLQTISQQINDVLDSAVNVARAGFTAGATFDDFKACLSGLVLQGGLRTGESCVRNGASVTGLQNIYGNVLGQYNSVLPTNVIDSLEQSGKAILDSNSAIIPGEADLVEALNNVTLSVTASTTGDFVQAVDQAMQCYAQAMSAEGGYDAAIEYACNHASTNSAFSTVQTLYQSIVNQFIGVLPPLVITAVQKIGANSLPLPDTAAKQAMSEQISNAILSVAASTSGNTATLVSKLIGCLDYVGPDVPTTNVTASEQCLSQPGGAVQMTAQRITDGYIQQLYGYLPPNLILDLQQQVLPSLDNASSDDAAAVKKQLDDLFTASGAGPAYVTCYQGFESCVTAALLAGSTKDACLLQYACAMNGPPQRRKRSLAGSNLELRAAARPRRLRRSRRTLRL